MLCRDGFVVTYVVDRDHGHGRDRRWFVPVGTFADIIIAYVIIPMQIRVDAESNASIDSAPSHRPDHPPAQPIYQHNQYAQSS